jgi:hypothetical protein
MKKLGCFYLMLFAIVVADAQTGFDKSSKLGIVLGAGNADITKFKSLYGSGGRDGKGYFVAGISYIKPLKKWFSFETGLEYSHYKIKASSAPMPEMWYWDTEASLITMPVNARFNFLKYFYGQGGLLFDIDISKKDDIDKQTGIGVNLGLGAQYNFRGGLSLFLNPYIRHHGLIAFDPPRSIFSNDMIRESGVKLGILYALKKGNN